ncbi:AAA family ATPase, partial [Deinococcus sp. 12RED42]
MLQSVTLQGFKSFADRTRLDFGPGVSAVIGPNGSGKSNVVEAIRWATHQARARELRAARAQELIFHGSGGKAPLGLAEVQLELRTPGGERVNLARRIYRDGTAEQDLNGRPARVRDVHGALRGTGLGPGGLAVIGQGEVSGVVQAEGKTLLGYVQEAAGLSRAVTARQDTEARLREADTHLDALRLVLQERAATLARLERAAQDARRWH